MNAAPESTASRASSKGSDRIVEVTVIGRKISDRTPHTGHMPVLLIILLAVPIIELWLIVQVASEIGVLNTIGALIVISVLGAWLLKQQGLATWARLQAALARGEMPTKEVTDGALIL